MNQNIMSKLKSYDYLGVFLSFICGIHCLVTPILIIYLPVVGEAIESIWFHSAIIGIMIFAFYHSIYKHFKIHHSRLILGLGLTGLTFFIVSYINELTHHSGKHEHGHELSNVHGDETSMIYIAIAGAIFLISAHLLNIRKCRCIRGKGVCKSKEI